MTLKELRYIESRIEQFRLWAEEERQEATRSRGSQERDEHRLQEQLNDCAANTLQNLLTDLTSGKARPSSMGGAL